ncbi:hypothetical protein [Alicyclobacillus sp. ALC3]|uniref:hypothetical protein n=1 Tax=Alicyclobacillus sp. ALC3 TaxID=2796143 RepID=UPI002378F81E|nr:hypothetical protein [Alicyclobacillus sp. ALC3]
MSQDEERGMFFCANCGHTPLTGVTYVDKPTDGCSECGFSDWIFEPTDDEDGGGQGE